MILAFRRPCGGNLGGLNLRPLYLDSGEGHPGTFYEDRPLDGITSRTRLDQPLHKSEVAAGYGLGCPKTDYYILHGQSGHPVQLGQLLQLIAKGR